MPASVAVSKRVDVQAWGRWPESYASESRFQVSGLILSYGGLNWGSRHGRTDLRLVSADFKTERKFLAQKVQWITAFSSPDLTTFRI